MSNHEDLFRKGLLIVLVVVSLVGGAFLFQTRSNQPSRMVSALSQGPLGLDLFRTFLAEVGVSTRVQKRALFERPSEELLIIAGPQLEISEREAKVIHDYAAAGNTVYVSAHDASSEEALRPLLKAVGIRAGFREREGYHSGSAEDLSSIEPLTQRGPLTLAFYSPFNFPLTDCSQNPASCLYKEVGVGRGRLILQLGLPVFSNALIGRAANRQIALEIAEKFESIVFDEYHHFAREKSWGDLLTDLQVALPLYGIFALACLYFLYGNLKPSSRRSLRETPARIPDYLELRDRLVRGIIRKPGRAELNWQRTELIRLFPGKRPPTKSAGDSLSEAQGLLQYHRAQLRERRGQSTVEKKKEQKA